MALPVSFDCHCYLSYRVCYNQKGGLWGGKIVQGWLQVFSLSYFVGSDGGVGVVRWRCTHGAASFRNSVVVLRLGLGLGFRLGGARCPVDLAGVFITVGGMVPGEAMFVSPGLPVLLSEEVGSLREGRQEFFCADLFPANVFFAALCGVGAGGLPVADIAVLE